MSKLFGKALSVGIGIGLGAAALAQTAPTAEAVTRYKALIERVRADMFRAGPAVPGWDRGGANPDAELRSAGPDRFYYLVEKKNGLREVIVMTDRPIAAVAPPDWRPVREFGSAQRPAEHAVIEFAPIDSWHVLAMRGGGRRVKDVDCMSGITHAILFVKPGMPADADADRARYLVKIILDAAEGQIVCSRYEGDRAHGWEIRHFLPDGREIVVEQGSRMSIVPAAPIDSLIAIGD